MLLRGKVGKVKHQCFAGTATHEYRRDFELGHERFEQAVSGLDVQLGLKTDLKASFRISLGSTHENQPIEGSK